MKRKDLIKTIEKMDCVLICHGGKHDWYQNPDSRICQPVPRHREINESLARPALLQKRTAYAGSGVDESISLVLE